MVPDRTTFLRLGHDDHGRLLSAEDFADACFEEPWKYERADGRLIVMHPDSEARDDTTEPFLEKLFLYKSAHRGLVEKVVSEAWVVTSDLTDRIGDIGVFLVRADRSTPPPRPERVPELMFEVVSETGRDRRRDYVQKKADYHKIGVSEYVVVDRFSRKVTVFTHEPDGYVERVLAVPEVYETPLLPGLRITLDEVFRPGR